MRQGRLIPELAELAPKGDARLGANPHANGGLLLKDLRLPDFREYGIDVDPGKTKGAGYDRAGRIYPRHLQTEQREQELPYLRTG